MFEKLIELLQQMWESILPFTVIDVYERGVVLRFGVDVRVLEPGFHWVCPLLERVLSDNVVSRTGVLGLMSLITKDGVAVSLVPVVTSKIVDIRKALLEVEHVDQVVLDACAGTVGTLVLNSTWDEVIHEDFPNRLAVACRRRAKQYGVEIERVQLMELTKARAIRLLQDSPRPPAHLQS